MCLGTGAAVYPPAARMISGAIAPNTPASIAAAASDSSCQSGSARFASALAARTPAATAIGTMPVSSTIESATMIQASMTQTATGTSQCGRARSITSQTASSATAVPVWSGACSSVEVALSCGASTIPAASRKRARPSRPPAPPLASRPASSTSSV